MMDITLALPLTFVAICGVAAGALATGIWADANGVCLHGLRPFLLAATLGGFGWLLIGIVLLWWLS
ncbi:hypothetical protein FDP22_12460 [Paroceanicella profunda]|uniref:Uncharacterized protein n=1 Tax=Paroceanicella profunda TaxID=2579971 RepID=A0A5B8FYR0_9RHOB|nr:hypothetical protein [Paroceanicella profunda]QDL92520.1 hypothetical protein FDP22_12460 [Paroceanicella profunda]